MFFPRAAAAVLFLTAAALPPRLAAQCPNGTPPPCAGTIPVTRSVAVLTFQNITGDSAVRGQMQRIAGRSFPWFWLRRPLYDGIRNDPRIAGYLSLVQREVAAVRWR